MYVHVAVCSVLASGISHSGVLRRNESWHDRVVSLSLCALHFSSQGYASLQDFGGDCMLIFSNCMKYNTDPVAGADICVLACMDAVLLEIGCNAVALYD